MVKKITKVRKIVAAAVITEALQIINAIAPKQYEFLVVLQEFSWRTHDISYAEKKYLTSRMH